MNAIAAIVSLLSRVASHHLVQRHLKALARQAGKELLREAIRYAGSRGSTHRAHRV